MYTREAVLAAGRTVFHGDELAASTFLKYALRNKESAYLELTPDEMHHRLAKEFARIENKYPNPLSEDIIFNWIKDFQYIVPQGSPMMGIGNNFSLVSLSNCVVIPSPEDNMSGIFYTATQMANLYKRRCGVGVDISTLRPDGSPVSNAAGSSSGAWSFADLYSYVTRMVGQNNRRGALMITMDVRHPDIFKFVTMKRDKKKVTGANISVRITDEFMQAVKEDKEFLLRWPCDSDTPKHTQQIRARDLWDTIIESATYYAEPGLLFWDTIIKGSPADFYSDQGFKTICTNPCSELPLSGLDSCRLISLNLKWFVVDPFTPNAKFNWPQFTQAVHVAQRLSDDLVDLEIEKLEALAKKTINDPLEHYIYSTMIKNAEMGRRTGLGTHGLADVLARLRITYGSEESKEFVYQLFCTLKESAYGCSVQLAHERGPFPIWKSSELEGSEFLQELPTYIKDQIRKYGRRNISCLTNAPTGSVSILSQTSSGIEPVFRAAYKRRKKKTQDDTPSSTDYVDDLGDRWEEFEVVHQNLQDYRNLFSTKDTPAYFVDANNVNNRDRILLQSIMQQHIDHAISSTINLPAGTSTDVVSNIYISAHEHSLKGITVYVDGSRDGVLVEDKPEIKEEFFGYKEAYKRPESLECDIHHVKVKGERWTILVGKIQNNPYEIFGGSSDEIELSKDIVSGTIVKRKDQYKKSVYDLVVPNGIKIKNVVKTFNNPLYQVHTRMISLALRHGTQPSFLVEQLQKDPDNDLSSFSKVVARVLKTYVVNGTKVSTDKICPECKSEELVYQDGCPSCRVCGWTKCG